MHQITAFASGLRHMSKVAFLGGLSTVVAAAGTTWLITGSGDPAVWIANYRHALQCAVADPALSTSCYSVAAVPAVGLQAPERSAPRQSPASAEPPSDNAPAGPPPQASATPQTAPPAYESDDSTDDGSDS